LDIDSQKYAPQGETSEILVDIVPTASTVDLASTALAPAQPTLQVTKEAATSTDEEPSAETAGPRSASDDISAPF
jgi:hypothetical protein